MPRTRPTNVWLPLLVMHAAMMAATIMYGVMAYAVAESEPAAAPPMDHAAFLAIAGAAAAVCAALSFVMRAKLLPPRAEIPEPRATFDLAVLRTPAGKAALAQLRTALIVSWSLAEGIAIAGLTAALLFHDPADYAPFGAAALLVLVVLAPRPRLLVGVMRGLPESASH